MLNSTFRITYLSRLLKKANFIFLCLFFCLFGCDKSDDVLLPDVTEPERIYLASFAEEVDKGQTLTIDFRPYVTTKGDWQLVQVTDPKALTTIVSITDSNVTLKADYSGLTQLRYTVSSHDKTYHAEVLLAIKQPSESNSQPTAQRVSRTLLSDESITIDLNDVLHDIDGDELVILELTQTAERFSLSGMQLSYTPNGFVGSDFAMYGVMDGKGGVTVGEVVMTVSDANPSVPNQQPVALDLQSSAIQGEQLIIDVNDLVSDPDADEVRVIELRATSGRAVISHSSLNTIEYDSSSIVGEDSFIYVVTDGKGGFAAAEITIDVKPKPIPIPLSVTPLVFDLTVGEQNTIIIDSAVTSGLEWQLVEVVSESALVKVLEQNHNSVTIETLSSGVAVLDYAVATANERQSSQIFVAISAVDNTAPVASNIAKTTNSETSISLDLMQLVSDPDGGELTLSSELYQLADRFTLQGSQLTYTPAGFIGVESVTYIVTDEQGGYGVGMVVVNSVDANPVLPNNPPTATDLNFSTDSKTPIKLDLSTVVADADGDSLAVAVYASNGRAQVNGLTITYSPNEFWGIDEIVYVVSDSKGGFALGTIVFTVSDASPVNNVPVAQSYRYNITLAQALAQPEQLIDISGLVSDADGDALALTQVMAALNPTHIEGDLLIKYTLSSLHASDRFTYVVEDGKGGVAQNIIEVSIVNSAPVANAVAVNIDPFEGAEPSISIDLTDTAITSDPDGDELKLTYVGKVVAPATLTQDGMTLTYRPNGAEQIETITYTVFDGMESSSNVISIISSSDTSLTATSVRLPAIEMDSVKVPVDLNHYVTNSSGRATFIERIFGARLGNVEFEPDSMQFSYQPNNISYGVDTFYYLVADNEGHQVQESVTVEIIAPAKPSINELTLSYAGPITASMSCVDCEHPTKTDYQFEVAGLPIVTTGNTFNPSIHEVEQNIGVVVTAKNNYCTADNQGVAGGNACKFTKAKVVIRADYLDRVYSNDHAFAALKTDKTVVAWGDRGRGGSSSTVDAQLFDVKSISATSGAFAALKNDNTVVTWGGFWDGGNSAPVADKLVDVDSLHAIIFAFTALKADGTVVSWGDANYGGDNSLVSDELYNITQVHGASHAFAALRSDGKVLSWGAADMGGDNSSVQAQLTNVKQIYPNYFAFAALKKDRTVVTWGGQQDGGNSSKVAAELFNVEAIYSNRRAFVAVREDGSAVAWGSAAFGGDHKITASLVGVKHVYSNNESFAVIQEDGKLISWGVAAHGGDSSAVVDQLIDIDTIVATERAYAALKADGTVVTWGHQLEGGDSSLVKDKLNKVQAIYANHKAFAALKADGTVVTWGDPLSGGQISDEIAANLVDVRSIYATGSAFIALKGNGDMLTWGNPEKGGDSSSAQQKMLSQTVLYKNLNLN